MKCERCKAREATAQRCPGDGATHGHGRVHIKGGGLLAVCDPCLAEVQREWNGDRPTPGRLKVEQSHRAGVYAAHIVSGVTVTADVYREPDARLYAATPDLVRVLRKALNYIATDCEGMPSNQWPKLYGEGVKVLATIDGGE